MTKISILICCLHGFWYSIWYSWAQMRIVSPNPFFMIDFEFIPAKGKYKESRTKINRSFNTKIYHNQSAWQNLSTIRGEIRTSEVIASILLGLPRMLCYAHGLHFLQWWNALNLELCPQHNSQGLHVLLDGLQLKAHIRKHRTQLKNNIIKNKRTQILCFIIFLPHYYQWSRIPFAKLWLWIDLLLNVSKRL